MAQATQHHSRFHNLSNEVLADLGFLGPIAGVAAEIVTMERSDLVELADNEYDELAPILMELTSAKDDARVLANVIHIAERRLAIALAKAER